MQLLWTPRIVLDESGEQALFVQIASGLASEIDQGHLLPGQRLPSSRRLAQMLDVHRNTVLAAYRELETQGLLATDPRRGTFVSEDARALAPRASEAQSLQQSLGYELPPPRWPNPPPEPPRPAGALLLAGGLPDPRLFPGDLLARAQRRALRLDAEALLDYGDSRGDRRLRAAVAELLRAERGLRVDAQSLLITRGSQMSIWMAAHAVLRPGDHVAVESYGYRPAFDALRAAGAVLHPIDVDDDGIDVDAVERLLEHQPLRALYLTPHHQYPTLVTLSEPRRARLRELARQHRIAVFEDDYDNEFHYEGRPVLPMASRDDDGNIVYIGTLSKVLAPGLRIGYMVAPGPVLDACLGLRLLVDRQGDLPMERAVAELIEDGEVQRHIRRCRRIYARRRDHFCALLAEQLGPVLHFERPRGGMALWCRVREDIDVEAWARRCAARGVHFMPGAHVSFDGAPKPFLRVGYARLNEAELARAVGVMAEALP